jgi:hypothetical protein
MVAKGWTEHQKRLYVIADNKLAMNAGWDEDILASELSQLLDDGVDVELSGFSLDEIAELTADNEAIEELAQLKDPNGGDSKVNKLTFGKKTVPLTDEELAKLEASLEAHVNEYGIMNGWVGKLLDV